jgi:membrane protease YdiL (CAAX protease family)
VVAEELFYRGYAIERLQELTRSRAIAGIFSGAVFTFAHVATWGWAQLLFAGFAAIILTLLYLWRRNLWVNIITHAAVDGVGVLAA